MQFTNTSPVDYIITIHPSNVAWLTYNWLITVSLHLVSLCLSGCNASSPERGSYSQTTLHIQHNLEPLQTFHEGKAEEKGKCGFPIYLLVIITIIRERTSELI